MSTQNPAPGGSSRRVDRFLTFVVLGGVVLSLLCFVVLLIARAAGLNLDDLSTGVWPVISTIPLIALPLALLTVLVLLVLTFIRKGRATPRS